MDPDPGSGILLILDRGSGMEKFWSGINILDPQHWKKYDQAPSSFQRYYFQVIWFRWKVSLILRDRWPDNVLNCKVIPVQICSMSRSRCTKIGIIAASNRRTTRKFNIILFRPKKHFKTNFRCFCRNLPILKIVFSAYTKRHTIFHL